MAINWSRCWGQPQTYLLLIGTALGYAALLGLAGPRPLAWAGGGGIAAAMGVSWVAGFRRSPAVALGHDLLDADTFNHQLDPLGRRVPAQGQKTWRQVQGWATESQRFAAQIYQRDPLLQVELLEALHTVIDLAKQVAEGLTVIDQIETPTYRQLAQQRVEASRDRLQATHAQLQQLQDQVALSSLETDSTASSPLPDRLQTLITANKYILEDHSPD
jgi:hypothetical protein